jgi:branched-subunit amino acid aminotransferase/4-amino-4-deoxychorismate lyase
MVVAQQRHLERFRASVSGTTDIADDTCDDFLHALPDAVPREGSWFPRIEAVQTPGGATLRCRQRSAPEWSSQVVVARAPHDPRRFPLLKGPDIENLLALRTAVQPVGAGEAIITSAHDHLIEGAYSSLMVWLPGSAKPSVIHSKTPHLPGVTEAVLREILSAEGLEPEEKDLTVADIEGAELWILSSLHGIRLATEFVDGPQLGVVPGRREHWQEAWRATALPMEPLH